VLRRSLLLGCCILSISCLHPSPWPPRQREVVLVPARSGGEGVVYRRRAVEGSCVDLIDVDLNTPGVQIGIHARRPTPGGRGWAVGDAFSLPVWCRMMGAVGGVNGGFFGEEILSGRKEVIGLLQLDGRLYEPAALYRARPNRSVTYAHSAFGLSRDGRPMIDWVVSDRRDRRRLLRYERPERLRNGRPWPSASAIAGGPRLIHGGQVEVADRGERLVSPGELSRTFVAYSVRNPGKRRLVMGTATAMTYRDVAAYLSDYFRNEAGVVCEEAMCLDGGPSSQLSYRHGAQVHSSPGAGEPVPTCLLVHANVVRGGE
jgi:hypothetical protein